MIGVTPGMLGAPFSGRLGPPLALYQSNTCRMATSEVTGFAVPGGLMSAPR